MQADRTSAWFGMSMANTAPSARVRLEDGLPAYLEVSVDPAAHGDAGLGPVRRSVMLRTASGQTLQFEVAAYVVR